MFVKLNKKYPIISKNPNIIIKTAINFLKLKYFSLNKIIKNNAGNMADK
jgi:hypothetical protein